MTRSAKRIYLIKYLLQEQPQYKDMIIPENEPEQKDLLRSLFNIRRPSAVSEDFLTIQDSYLKEETAQKGITDFTSMTPIRAGIYIWRGDITALRRGRKCSKFPDARLFLSMPQLHRQPDPYIQRHTAASSL